MGRVIAGLSALGGWIGGAVMIPVAGLTRVRPGPGGAVTLPLPVAALACVLPGQIGRAGFDIAGRSHSNDT